MQFKVYRGSFGLLILLILAVVFFMLPAILMFIALATVASIIGSLATGLLSFKTKRPVLRQEKTNGKTIDITAEIE